MKFRPTDIEGCVLVDLAPRGDERGFFARLFDRDEFAQHGLETEFPQMNTSFSAFAGTLRGLHFQISPHGEAKLVKCLKGAIFDVVVDLRSGSDTYGRWVGAELTDANRTMMYVPKGCAHGFMTLVDGTEVFYPASSVYQGEAERALRWNAPDVGIVWPLEPAVISEKDANAGDLAQIGPQSGYSV